MELVGSGCKDHEVACHLAEVLQWLRELQNDEHDLDFSATDSKVVAGILANHIQAAMNLLDITPTTYLEVMTPANFLKH